MRGRAGFTLLETLAVLALLGFVILALSQGARFGLTAWATRDRLEAEAAELDAADRLIRRLIEHAAPGTEQNPAGFLGTSRTLALRSDLPLSAGSDAARRIDALLGVDERHRLVLRWVPYRHARRLGPPPAAGEAVLVHGLDRLILAYWGRVGPSGPMAWSETWKGPAPPALIRMRLVFPPGSPRSWPEIAAAPREEAPAE